MDDREVQGDEQLISQLAERAQGLTLTGQNGLLARLTKAVIEGALEGEMDAHLGYARHERAEGKDGNARNGKSAKTLLTDIGPVEVDMPRDRAGSFDPQVVRKRQRRLSGVDDLVVSLAAKGPTTGEIAAHLGEAMAPACRRRRSPRSPTGCWRAWPTGRTGLWTRSTR